MDYVYSTLRNVSLGGYWAIRNSTTTETGKNDDNQRDVDYRVRCQSFNYSSPCEKLF